MRDGSGDDVRAHDEHDERAEGGDDDDDDEDSCPGDDESPQRWALSDQAESDFWHPANLISLGMWQNE